MSCFKGWPPDVEIRREWSFDDIMRVSLSNPCIIELPKDAKMALRIWHEWLQWMEFQAFRQQGRRWGTKTHQACVESIDRYQEWIALVQGSINGLNQTPTFKKASL